MFFGQQIIHSLRVPKDIIAFSAAGRKEMRERKRKRKRKRKRVRKSMRKRMRKRWISKKEEERKM